MNSRKSTNLNNKDFSELNKSMFSIISNKYKKEIPYAILEYSPELDREIIKYIPIKDLDYLSFRKNGKDVKFTNNLKDYVNIKEIPISNYFLVIDSAEVSNIMDLPKIKKVELGSFMVDGKIDIEKYMNTDVSETRFKINDLDGMSYFVPNLDGLYFFTTDEEGLNSIIMFDKAESIFSLNYVTTASRARGNGLSLNLYKTAMTYIVEQGGILVRSEPTELGAAFIEDKITKMLQTDFPYEPVLSSKTKDINLHIRMIASDVDKNEMKNLKSAIFKILELRRYVKKVNVLGEYSDFEITEDMTKRDKAILNNCLSVKVKRNKKLAL